MYAGEIVLEGPARSILKSPIHPYTYGLLKSIPKLSLSGLPDSMPGSQPQPGNIGRGCSFYDRCEIAEDKCKKNSPNLERILELQTNVRCFNYKNLKNFNDEINSLTQKKNIKKNVNEILNLTDVSISYAKQKFLDQIFNKVTDTKPNSKRY